MNGMESSFMQDAFATLMTQLGNVIVPPWKELTLKQQAPLTGISEALLRRRWKYHADWHDAIYAVGESGTDYRTTLGLINRCRERAAKRALAKALIPIKKKSVNKKAGATNSGL